MNEKIFEAIYFGAMTASMEVAKVEGPYETYEGSPISKGIFQFDMWGVTPKNGFDWSGLKEQVAKFGIRNSLLVAPMPTASTSQILGNNESFEPYTSNIFTRRVLSGEFVVLNPHMVQDLIKEGLWTNEIKNQIVADNGSVQKVTKIPAHMRELYKTIWEVKQKTLIDLAAGRAPFIDQSQSLNVYLPDPTYSKLTSMHFYGWKKGMKTGMYYLRSRPAADAIKFTVDVEALLKANNCELNCSQEEALKEVTNKANSARNMLGKKRKMDPSSNNKENEKSILRGKDGEVLCDNYDYDNDMCLSCGS